MINNIHYIALTIGGNTITAPGGVPQGGVDTGQKIIQTGIQLFFIVGVIITLYYVIQSGIQWTVSRGDKQLLEQARLRLTYAIIGLIIIVLAFAIVSIVGGFFGINFFGAK